jgi:DNA-binding IclR family transcriptional regulator
MSPLSNAVLILRWLVSNGKPAQRGRRRALAAQHGSRVKDMAAHGLLERDQKSARYRASLMQLEVGRHYGAGRLI